MKKLLTLLLTLGLLLAAAGCAGRQEEGKPVRVGLVAGSGGLSSDPMRRLAWEGLQALSREDSRFDCLCRETKNDEESLAQLEAFAAEGRELIVALGVPAGLVIRTAKNYPQLAFAILSEEDFDLPNLACVTFPRNEEGYLAGLAAGLTTDSGTVGYVQGPRTAQLDQYAAGYLAGVKAAAPKARIVQTRVRSLLDADGGEAAATDLIANGADVIFHAAGGAGAGVIAACKTHGVWAIGADTDQSALAPGRVLTSALQRIDVAVQDLAKAVSREDFQPGLRRYGIAQGGVTLAKGLLSEAAVTGVESAVKRVQAGTVTVPSTPEELEALWPGLFTLS